MRRLYVALGMTGLLAGSAVVVESQSAPPAAAEPAPTLEQMRRTMSRLRGRRIATPTNYDTLNDAQKRYVQSILSGPRADISGPLGVMMVTPGLGDLMQKAMAYSRFAGREGFSSVPPKLNELAILVVAKHWRAEYVWNAHHNAAVRFGVPAAVVESIRTGARPTAMEPDVAAIYEFATEFINTRAVGDATLARAKAVLGGDRGVVDLVGTMGLYQISSMMVALDETPLPEGRQPFLH